MAEIAGRKKHEQNVYDKMFDLSEKHRKELQDLLGHPPDVSRVTPAFWDRVQQETEEELIALLLLIFIASATQHGASQSEAAARAAQFAKPQAATVAKGFADKGAEMLNTASQAWNAAASRGNVVPKNDVLDRLTKIFGPDRITGVAVTETTNAATSGSEAGMSSSGGGGLNPDDIWLTSGLNNVCPICRPLNKKKRPVWSAKFPEGPPAHPRCNCFIKYAAAVPAELVTT